MIDNYIGKWDKKRLMFQSEFVTERQIGEIKVLLPNPPEDITQILNYEEKVLANQKWKPPRIPTDKELKDLPSNERIEFIRRELDRRTNGVFFFNHGGIEYLTGKHYFYLTYWRAEGVGLPDFRDADRDFFYAWEEVEKDTQCFGLAYYTNRRQGKTMTSTSILYEFASRNKEVHCGIQSQTNKDAKNVFRKVVFSWKKMPYFWKPTDSGDKNPKEALRFEEPSTRSSKGEVKTYKEVLDSFIDFASSTETAYDGYKLSRYYCDEFGKFTEGNAYSRWNIVKPCLQVGARIIGKAIFTTTVEELEKGGGQAAYDIYKDSDPNNKGADNRTASGLYRLFKPAYYGYEGYLDEYGYSDIEGAKKHLVAERQNKQGADLAELTRKFPFNIKEAFQSSISTNVFPVFKIIQQKEWNIENGKEPRKGNFIWENEELRVVKFVDDPNGKFQVSWLPKEEDRSKFEIIRDLPSPLFKNQGAFGVDPYDHRTTVDKERYSKGACAGFRRYDAMNPENSNAFFLSYLNRPPKETILYEDLTKAFIFYGMQGLIENQKTGMHNWMNDNGFKHYIMKTQQGDYSKNTSRKFIDGVSTSGVMIREQMINGLESYIYDFIGNISPDVQRNFYGLDERSIRADLYGTCPFEDMLSDWEKFDSNDWTDYDMAVATMLAKLAVTPVRKKRLEESEDKQITLNSFFKLHKI